MRFTSSLLLTFVLGIGLLACNKDPKKTETATPPDSTKKETSATPASTSNDTSAVPEKTELAPEVAANVKVGTDKIGYLNSQELLLSVPEAQAIDKKLSELYKGKEAEIRSLSATAQAKLESYQKNAEKLDAAERETREKELMGYDQQIQELSAKGQDDMEKERQKLLAPVLKKLDKVVKNVAKEYGYTYVLDPSMGGMVYADSTRDLMPLVKEKLGIRKKK